MARFGWGRTSAGGQVTYYGPTASAAAAKLETEWPDGRLHNLRVRASVRNQSDE
jgi:hypothetical protein